MTNEINDLNQPASLQPTEVLPTEVQDVSEVGRHSVQSELVQSQYTEPHNVQQQHVQQQYAQPQQVQPQYVQEQYTQSQYAQPQEVQPQYAEPQLAQPQQVQPHYAQVQHAQEQYAQPQQPQPPYVGAQYVDAQYVDAQYSRADYGQQQYASQNATQPVEARQRPAKRGGALVAGILIGTLIGAVAGGATGAIVANSFSAPATVSAERSAITINSNYDATQVAAVAQVATESVVTVEVVSASGSGTGSGVIYSADGYIITNAHVVTMTDSTFAETRVRVFLSDGRIMNAQIVGSDPYADIAVLKVEAEGLTPVKVSSSEEVAVGDLAVAIGAPFNLSNTVTSGVVSTVYRGIAVGSPLLPKEENSNENQTPWNFDLGESNTQTVGGTVTLPVIQTDADINPGNSGGALLNQQGELIGINVAIASTGGTDARAGSVGLGFAIPSSLAVRVADSIIANEKPSHGLLGATVEDSRRSETSTVRGGLISSVISGGAADRAGVKAGDVVVSISGVATIDGTSVSAMVRYFESGKEVKVGIQRGNEIIYKDVVLGSLT